MFLFLHSKYCNANRIKVVDILWFGLPESICDEISSEPVTLLALPSPEQPNVMTNTKFLTVTKYKNEEDWRKKWKMKKKIKKRRKMKKIRDVCINFTFLAIRRNKIRIFYFVLSFTFYRNKISCRKKSNVEWTVFLHFWQPSIAKRVRVLHLIFAYFAKR